MHKAFARLDATAQAGLERDIRALLERLDTGGGRSLVVPGEYLQVVIVKRKRGAFAPECRANASRSTNPRN